MPTLPTYEAWRFAWPLGPGKGAKKGQTSSSPSVHARKPSPGRIQTHQNNSKHKTIHCYNDDSLVLQVVGQRLLIMPYKPSETGQHFLVEEK